MKPTLASVVTALGAPLLIANATAQDIDLNISVADIPGDQFSQGYLQNPEKSVLYQGIQQARDFYNTMGLEYQLEGIDIQLDPNQQIPDSQNTFTLQYVPLDTVLQRIEQDEDIKQSIYGERMTPGRVATTPEQHKKIAKALVQEAGGIAFYGDREMYLISREEYTKTNLDNPQVRENAIALTRYMAAHEFGHALGLDHVEPIEQNAHNIMYDGTSIDAIFNPKLEKEQVEQIIKHFKQ